MVSILSPQITEATEPRTWRWTRDQYYQMAELGWFNDKRVELINGEIIEMSPMNSRHATAVTLVSDMLRSVFSTGYFVRIQEPLDLGEFGQPEPDVAIVSGRVRDYTEAHPTAGALVVEVSDTTLRFDSTTKVSLYATANIPEYWIVNLLDNQVEVYRRPAPRPEQPLGFGYMDLIIHRVPEIISPLAVAQAAIAVADLLP